MSKLMLHQTQDIFVENLEHDLQQYIHRDLSRGVEFLWVVDVEAHAARTSSNDEHYTRNLVATNANFVYLYISFS